jgi:hypothetical protein
MTVSVNIVNPVVITEVSNVTISTLFNVNNTLVETNLDNVLISANLFSDENKLIIEQNEINTSVAEEVFNLIIQTSVSKANTIHNGDGPPSSVSGSQNGDYYIDNLNKAIYGPLISSDWGNPTYFGTSNNINPIFTYNISGQITNILYDNGVQKVFTYNSGVLVQLDIISDVTIRKTFHYTSGVLTSITQIIL